MRNLIQKIDALFLKDGFILLLILLNAIIIFIGGFDWSDVHQVLRFVDNAITILFIVELIVKLRTFGREYFSSGWNRLDFILILIATPDLFLWLFDISMADYSFLLVFRVLRAFKFFRFIQFVPGVGKLLKGIQKALKSSVIVILGFVIYLFVIGVLSFYFFRNQSHQYFGDPLQSINSVFRIFTVEGWYEIPDSIVKGMNPFYSFITYLYFVFVLLSGGIFGLSLVNSIFVDSMVSDNNEELENKVEALENKIDSLIQTIHHGVSNKT